MNLTILMALYTQILVNQPNLNQYDAMEIALINTELSEQYEIDPYLVTAIQMQESSYRLNAKNNRDCGLMQVGPLNQKEHKISCGRLRTDVRASIEAGIKVLAWFQKTYKKREPKTWFCRYNCGTGPMTWTKKRLCNRYIKLVNRWALRSGG